MDKDWKFFCDCGHTWTGPFPETDEDAKPCPSCTGDDYSMAPWSAERGSFINNDVTWTERWGAEPGALAGVA